MSSRRIRIELSYDGTDFYGWQIQNDGRTVQGVLEKGLEKIHGYPVRATAAGRTDSGVHAEGQVCHFDTDLNIPPDKFRYAINRFLPPDMSVVSSCRAEDDFHSRFSAKSRVYKYYLTDYRGYTVFNRNYCVPVKNLPDHVSLNSCAEMIRGVHDFTSFTTAGDKSKSRVREIYSAEFLKEGVYTVFRIEGNAFLWKMVRSLVGTIMEQAVVDPSGGSFRDILESCDRSLAGTTAPPKGLFFHKVNYQERGGFKA